MDMENINKLSQAVPEIINESAQWYLWSSVGWILFGIGLMVLSYIYKHPGDNEAEEYWIKIIIVIIGGLVIAINFGDLLAPRAAAIFRLLHDHSMPMYG